MLRTNDDVTRLCYYIELSFIYLRNVTVVPVVCSYYYLVITYLPSLIRSRQISASVDEGIQQAIMFKKLKDKLAEEVKSSPQRIQQFAQAAQVRNYPNV